MKISVLAALQQRVAQIADGKHALRQQGDFAPLLLDDGVDDDGLFAIAHRRRLGVHRPHHVPHHRRVVNKRHKSESSSQE